MKVIDRYIVSSFCLSLAICTAVLLGMYLVIDVFQKAEDFSSHFAMLREQGRRIRPVLMFLEYYALNIPLLLLRISPAITLMAAVFTVTRMSHANELVPLLACGVSIHRILVPVLASGAIVSLLLFAIQEVYVPSQAERIIRSRVLEMGNDTDDFQEFQTSDRSGRFFFVRNYDPVGEVLHGVRIWDRYPDGSLRFEIEARRGEFEDRKMVFSHGLVVRYHPSTRRRLPGFPQHFGAKGLQLATSLRQLDCLDRNPSDRSRFESLPTLIAEIERRPAHVSQLLVRLHARFALPVGNMILLLVGIPFVLGRETRNPFVGAGICILICFFFFTAQLVFMQLGNKEALRPLAAVWAPLVAFAAVGAAAMSELRT